MYNGTGLQTARGSGSNGYVQSNKFYVKPKTDRTLTGGNDVAGGSRKPNVEHERKRQMEIKLVVLEEKLVDEGCTDDEIGEKLNEARRSLEASVQQFIFDLFSLTEAVIRWE
ncbi:putative mRNA splicing factor Cwf21 domain-containing protein [Helianthus annuus]|uniref:mRNA splicing factor Cwf21 domain-containing protein n=1 Tax=Helianthus annuus TaxID=4232 RepID=A0A9K3JZ12_HELAN|nr:putative mRNA splicing factor Cwf21 domain-containing protein [Helianthus annuus]KAJ0612699.1 putative mRNA splicing factor Cwf21 domain-containing protein [Helianthus annuus]KAJ0624262.1 putative mRNA splicing factor Cwf21 domain-containing protein [Helianthus annuus]KAJ0628069.1 putative mRNA splicing factor Cwf21 domain-containing protein [Helianthus annuus]KAJ0784356.1 putative mRNA splicing factor Cwf21 domain-containing protein [Helianthus annuus]